jgi:uncharacterized protein YprB with RNaseH-like and TPR domain
MRVTVFDIEATDLGGNFGRLLCCSFIDLDSTTVETFRRDRRPWKGKKLTEDVKLAVAIRDRLEKSDIIVGWNSILYDVPFINTRLVAAGERPVRIGEKHGSHHLDLMYYAGGQSMRLPGRRLDLVAKFFHTDNAKTPLTPEVWANAATGDPEGMAEVVEHCEADIQVTKDVFFKLAPFVKKIQFNLSDVWPFLDQIPSRVVQHKG